MKFIYKTDKAFKNISINYVWVQSNLFIQVNYNANSKYEFKICYASIGNTVDNRGNTEFWIESNGKYLIIRPIAETKREKELLETCWTHTMSCDYCDTQIILMPAFKKEWDKNIQAKISKRKLF